MNPNNPSINDLFDQLGLESDNPSIERFIEQHRGLDKNIHLEDASFWNDAQAAFIKGALTEDAEWAELIDQLDIRLR